MPSLKMKYFYLPICLCGANRDNFILLRTRIRKSVTSRDPRSLDGALVDEKFRGPHLSELNNNKGT